MVDLFFSNAEKWTAAFRVQLKVDLLTRDVRRVRVLVDHQGGQRRVVVRIIPTVEDEHYAQLVREIVGLTQFAAQLVPFGVVVDLELMSVDELLDVDDPDVLEAYARLGGVLRKARHRVTSSRKPA